jgi:fructose-specific PTS system IIA-like component
MTYDYSFSCPLIHGLHARPASQLAQLASRFGALISLTNERSGHSADCRSVLEIVAAGVMPGDICVLHFEGPDAEEARTALVEFITTTLPHSDSPLPQSAQRLEPAVSLPRELAGQIDKWQGGIAAGDGLAIAIAVKTMGIALPPSTGPGMALDSYAEIKRFETARSAVLVRQEMLLKSCTGRLETEIQQALLSLTRDRGLQEGIVRLIHEENCNAEQAVVRAITHFTERMAESGSAYLQDRQGDIEDIGLQLLEEITGEQLRGKPLQLQEASIVCAPQLSVSSMLALDKSLLRGLVLGESGLTSHSVILARSHGIPVVAGVSELTKIESGRPLFIDGSRGLLIPDPDENVQRYFTRESTRLSLRQTQQDSLRSRPGATGDGRPLEIAANIASLGEVEIALERGAEGIGLFRTEMLFANASQLPSEDEQTALYSQVATGLAGRRLIMRTIDIGADKQLPWLALPLEDNPYLGLRGIRLCQSYPEILLTQLRALLRAAVNGPLWVMAPMISNTHEARWFREQYELARQQLLEQGQTEIGEIRLGCMIEVPSAALQIRALSEYFEFFSIGSNDLTQYTLAVDRGNEQVANLYRELHPALLRLLKLICDEARDCGRWVGLCGEFAARRLHAPLLAGLGLNEVSMSAPAIPAFKQALAACDSLQCRRLLDECIAAADAEAVQLILRSRHGLSASEQLLSSELISLQADCHNKTEAIRELCGLCELSGRTDSIDKLEDEIWERETTYSTGLGHGIAIPHCKSSEISVASLAVLRLSRPIDWDSLDGLPVDIVLLLAMPAEGDGRRHLKVFARLARRLMNEEFREGLRAAHTAVNIVGFLSRELELTEV